MTSTSISRSRAASPRGWVSFTTIPTPPAPRRSLAGHRVIRCFWPPSTPDGRRRTQHQRASRSPSRSSARATVWLIGLIALYSAGPRAGVWAAWIAAVYPPLVSLPAYALSETIYSAVALGAAFVLQVAVDRSAGTRARPRRNRSGANCWRARRRRRARAAGDAPLRAACGHLASDSAAVPPGSRDAHRRGRGHHAVDVAQPACLRSLRAHRLGRRRDILDRQSSSRPRRRRPGREP